MELALDAKNGIEILLRLDVLAQVIGQDPCGTKDGVRDRMERVPSLLRVFFHHLFIV
jgi:hypothetical protein